jgi:diguanylate cyclase (GGDEF)-like protein
MTDPGEMDGKKIPGATVSIGIAEYRPGDSLETLIAAADVAMYHAKKKGRNCVCVASGC